MNLQPYIEEVREQLIAAAEHDGDESRAIAERMTATIDATLRLALLEALSAAADEITVELAPGAVALRLRGRDPEFAVTVPVEPQHSALEPIAAPVEPVIVGDDAGSARITLRLSEGLKERVEDAAGREGLSVNSWLVRALTSITNPGGSASAKRPESSNGGTTGWFQ